MITDDKITEIFCATDEFSKKFDEEIENMPLLSSDGKARRRRAASMSDSEIMTILIMFHFDTFDNFKHYYLHFIRIHLKRDFPDAVSYNRFVEHNLRRYANKVFAGLATDGKGTMGWCHGFKLHFICNDWGEIIMFCLTGANVDDRDPKVWAVLGKRIYGKLFADRGYISSSLFDALFADGIHLVTGIKNNMKNRLMPLWDRIMLRKRYVIECINHLLKDKGNLVHSRHRSVNNFLMNLIAALGAYCFFDNKPEAIQGYCIEDTKQLALF